MKLFTVLILKAKYFFKVINKKNHITILNGAFNAYKASSQGIRTTPSVFIVNFDNFEHI